MSQSPVGYMITLLWAFSFCSRGKVCAGGKQLHSLSTCPCFLLNKITAKARKLDLGRLHSCTVIHMRTFVLCPSLSCKTVQQRLDLPGVLFFVCRGRARRAKVRHHRTNSQNRTTEESSLKRLNSSDFAMFAS